MGERGLLKLNLKLLLPQTPKLKPKPPPGITVITDTTPTHTVITMVDTMDTPTTTLERDLLKLNPKLMPKPKPNLGIMVITVTPTDTVITDTPMAITTMASRFLIENQKLSAIIPLLSFLCQTKTAYPPCKSFIS